MVNFVIDPTSEFSALDSLIISLIAILIVFIVLVIIIAITTGIQKGMEKVDYVSKINPRKENQILESDEDAVVAVLAATIDFHKEFNSDAKLVSIERID